MTINSINTSLVCNGIFPTLYSACSIHSIDTLYTRLFSINLRVYELTNVLTKEQMTANLKLFSGLDVNNYITDTFQYEPSRLANCLLWTFVMVQVTVVITYIFYVVKLHQAEKIK